MANKKEPITTSILFDKVAEFRDVLAEYENTHKSAEGLSDSFGMFEDKNLSKFRKYDR